VPAKRGGAAPVPRAVVRTAPAPRRAWILGILALALAGGLVARAGSPPGARAAAYDRFYADYQGEELMRVLNADRTALGKSAIPADPILIALARDTPVLCPKPSSLTVLGRVRDMAERGYWAHDVAGCTDSAGGTFDVFDMLGLIGYASTATAENLAKDNYPSSSTTYTTGCTNPPCATVEGVPWNVATAEGGWMSSSTHRANLLGAYSRFGCAAWMGAGGYAIYACIFASGSTSPSDTTAPTISGVTGENAAFPAGARPTFTATATDGQTRLSDGYASIDGVHVKDWAYDHGGPSASLSVSAPPLADGLHTFVWRIRDVATNARSYSFSFTIGAGSSAPPGPSPSATATASPVSSPTAVASVGATTIPTPTYSPAVTTVPDGTPRVGASEGPTAPVATGSSAPLPSSAPSAALDASVAPETSGPDATPAPMPTGADAVPLDPGAPWGTLAVLLSGVLAIGALALRRLRGGV